MEKIGLAITTKDRPEFLARSIQTIDQVDMLCVVNDGTPYPDSVYAESSNKHHLKIVQHDRNLGIACAKNTALRTLIQGGCDYLFLMEDDVLIKDPTVFQRYIDAAHESGLWHMNFGFSNIYNYNQDGSRAIREVVDYSNDVSIILTKNLVAGFQFFHKAVIRAIGYMDERYSLLKNMEHVDHSYRIVKAGLLPAYWFWPDINNSWDYLSVIPESIEKSTVRDEKFMENFELACRLFQHKHAFHPTSVPDTPREEVMARLQRIEETNSKKKGTTPA